MAETQLQFANASSVPSTIDVTNAIVDAVNSSNITLPVNTSSIVASSKGFNIFAALYMFADGEVTIDDPSNTT